jgi:RHS repeat-associated protein
VSAADGTIAARYEYGPFGELIRSTGLMAEVNPIRWSTKYQDNETDLLYYGYRYEKDGSWLSRDPIGEAGGINLYAYVNNSPVDWIDDLGERAIRPGLGRPGGRNPYRYPNGRPLPSMPPRPPNPNNQWPSVKQPSMCITISIPGSNQSGREAIEEGVIQELWDALKPPNQPPQLPPPAPPRPPSFCPPPPNSQSCVNAPPDLGLTQPPHPPRYVYAPRNGPPVLVAPGTIVIWY